MKIKERLIGKENPTYIIAEMSANHAGSIERAKEIIRAAKKAGADCVKIQTYTADTLTIDCDNEYFQIDQGTWKGENLYQLYGKAYTPWEWQKELKEEADKSGIDFFSTPFDKTSVDFLESINVEFYKIASFELVDLPLIAYVASKGKPMILSTGMATLAEIKEAVETIQDQGNENYALLKCSSAYPAVSEDMNLATIPDMIEKFKVPIGLSDHSMGSLGATTAVTLGATIIEKHFCMSRDIDNPDASFSMTPNEFKAMVDAIRNVEKAKGKIRYGVTKQEENSLIFRRSIFAVKNILKGEFFSNENIRSIRPSHGLAPKLMSSIIGTKAVADIERGTPLTKKVINLPFLREGIISDCEQLFQWRNEMVTRMNSKYRGVISLEDHEKWYNKLLNNDFTKLFLLQLENKAIGQIRLDQKGKDAVISFSIDCKYRGKGYGTKILELVEEEAVKRQIVNLEAFVRSENIASKKSFMKLSYLIKSESEEMVIYHKNLGE